MKVFRYLVLVLITMLAAGEARAQHPIHPAVRWANMGANQVTSITFSPDGSLIGNTIVSGYMLTETATGAIRAILPGSIHSATFSPDGELLVAAGYARIRLFDATTFQPVDTLDVQGIEPELVLFSPDGTRLVAKESSLMMLWDMQTRKLIPTAFRALQNGKPYDDVQFSRDARSIVALQGNRIIFYNAQDGSLLDSVTIPGASAIRLSPDGNTLLVAVRNGNEWSLVVWHYKDLRVVRILPLPTRGTPENTTYPADITVTPDGRYAAVSNGRASSLQFIDVETGAAGPALYFKGLLYTALFSPDDRYLAVAGYGLHIHLLDGATMSYIRDIPLGQEGGGRSLAISPDGGLVAASSSGLLPGNEWRIRVWDVATGRPKQMVATQRSHFLPLSFTPDGSGVMIPTYCGTSSAEIYSVESGEFIRNFPCDRNDRQRTIVATHPDKRRVLVYAGDEWRPVEVATGWPELSGSHRGIRDMKVAADGSILATWGADSLIRIWNLESREEISSIPIPHGSSGHLLAFTPNGSHLLLMMDYRLRVHEIATRQERELAGFKGVIGTLAVSPDGNWVLAAGTGGEIHVWRFSTGELAYNYTTAGSGITHDWNDLVIAPDFSSFTTLGSDGSVVNWSTDPIRSLSVPGERQPMPGNVPATMNLTAYPNPASAGAEIRFNPAGSFTGALRVYDASGRAIATLAEGTFEPGEQIYRWGDRVAPGLYIIGIQSEGEIVARTLLCVD